MTDLAELDQRLVEITEALQKLIGEPCHHLILVSDRARNYYVQFVALVDETDYPPPDVYRDAREIYAEAVGNDVLSGADLLSDDEVDTIRRLGWSPPEAADSHTPNFWRNFTIAGDDPFRDSAEVVLDTLVQGYSFDGVALEIDSPPVPWHVDPSWDDRWGRRH